jgi:hypothetical protein
MLCVYKKHIAYSRDLFMQEIKKIVHQQDPRALRFGEIRFPLSYLKHPEYRHYVTDRPNVWLELDIMFLPQDMIDDYNLMATYVIGCDVYSRYCMYYINPEATSFKARGSKLQNFRGIVDQIKEAFGIYPKFVSTDSEFNVSDVKEFCTSQGITLITAPPGTINATPVIDRIILKLKKLIGNYVEKYNDKMLARKEQGYSRMECSIKLMNAVVYFYNRKYNSFIKGIPVEIYFGIDIAKLPLANTVSYPQYEVGDKVFMRSRPRIKSEKLKAMPTSLRSGLIGEIKKKFSKSLYLIETPIGEIYAKWYEFYKIPDEVYNKLKSIKFYQGKEKE